MSKIPFNKPFIVGKELFYISQAVFEGNLAGDGKFTRLCSEWMETRFNASRVLLTTSCTAALEMSAILLDVGPGDEVILPSFTFVSTANAFALRGTRIRFIDIREDTLNMDESQLESMINQRTKALVPVHYAGVSCEMDTIMDIAQKHNVAVVEDAAQGVNAKYKEKYLGTIGHLGTYSFHETKNFISGEGGALVINDERFVERAEIIREKGTDRSKFFRGEVDKYSWVDVGSSYLPSEIIAAFLYAQLEEAETITRKRNEIYQYYAESLLGLQQQGHVRLPVIPEAATHNSHMFYLLTNSADEKDALILHLRKKGIHSVFHYIPLHSSPMGRKMGYHKGDLVNTEDLSARLLRLPCFFELKRNDQNRIIQEIYAFFNVK